MEQTEPTTQPKDKTKALKILGGIVILSVLAGGGYYIVRPAFESTGLKSASTFRVSKIITLEQNPAKRRLGYADKKLLQKLESGLKLLLNL